MRNFWLRIQSCFRSNLLLADLDHNLGVLHRP